MIHRKRGQSIIETVVGIMFLVPIALFLLDIGVVVLGHTANDNLAKTVARAAASAKDTTYDEGTSAAGFSAAQAAAGSFAESAIITKPNGGSFLTAYCWNGVGNPQSEGLSWPGSMPQPGTGNVSVMTTMTVKMPVPFPFLPTQLDFQAAATEPIVSIVAGAGTDADDSVYKAPSNKKPKVQNGNNPFGNAGQGVQDSSTSGSEGSNFGMGW